MNGRWAIPAVLGLMGAACIADVARPGVAVALAAGAVVALAAALLGGLWRCRAVRRALEALPRSPRRLPLQSPAASARVTVVAAADSFALCAGILRPRVFVSEGLLARLSPPELRAVLLHEASHARRRDPLRRALRAAAARAFWFAPGLRWWSDRAAVLDELCADSAALRHCSAGDLAGALLATRSSRRVAAPSFDGAAATRIAQLLGDPLDLPAPAAWVWAETAAALVAPLLLLGCVVATLAGGR